MPPRLPFFSSPSGPEPYSLDLSPTFADESMAFDVAFNPEGIGTFEEGPDGVMRLVPVNDDELPAGGDEDHTQNLANDVGADYRTRLANDLLTLVDDDIESRRPWSDRYRRGMEMMGLIKSEVDDGPFPGASTAVMPLISEAVVQFWARAFAEQVPAEGPAKAHVTGTKPTSEQIARARRMADYLNYDLMFQDEGWFNNHSRMIFALPKTGSAFKKTYYDLQLGSNTSIYVPAEDFICNYAFVDLKTAPRYAHRIWMTKNEYRKSVVAGQYLDEVLGEPQAESLPEETEVRIEASDFDPGSQSRTDHRYEVFECYVELDLPGFEDADEKGPTGIALPYVVTMERYSQKVLSIYRDWKETDPIKRRRVIFTQYDYLPGDGFYGYGLLHLIGGLQEAATGALRLVIDGSASASLQGGFITKDASLRDEDLVVEPGVWKQVDATAEDLSKAFFTPPFKEPDAVLFQVMGFLVQRGEKFAATTEMQTGTENSKNMPVGSTYAMIEAGAKVFSTIHKGLHKSLMMELRLRKEFLFEYMPVGGYPYDEEGMHGGLFEEDFAPGVGVVPVADPNIFSNAQRVAQNQAVYDLAIQNPTLMRRSVSLRRVLEGLKIPDIDELMVDTNPPPPMDPVSEVQAILRGDPVQAYPDQAHQEYLKHYWSFINNPNFGGNPQVQQQVGPQVMALIGQRLGYAWVAANRSLGVDAPMLPPVMGSPGGEAGQPGPDGAFPSGSGAPAVPTSTPPEVIARAAAQIAPQLVSAPGLPPPPNPGQAVDEAKAKAITDESQTKVAGMQQKQSIEADEAHIRSEMQARKQLINEAAEQAAAETKNAIAEHKALIEAHSRQMQDMVKAATAARDTERKEAESQHKQGLEAHAANRDDVSALHDAALKTAESAHKAVITEEQAARADEIKAKESETRRSTMEITAKAAAKRPARSKKKD